HRLVWTESHQDGWVARVDGRPTPALRVDGDFLGCLVGPGRHLVTFRFEPASHALGARLSALGLGLAGLLFVGSWKRKRFLAKAAKEEREKNQNLFKLEFY